MHGVPLPTRREFLRAVPWVSLVLGTLVYEIGVGVGLLFFVIPGLVVVVAYAVLPLNVTFVVDELAPSVTDVLRSESRTT